MAGVKQRASGSSARPDDVGVGRACGGEKKARLCQRCRAAWLRRALAKRVVGTIHGVKRAAGQGAPGEAGGQRAAGGEGGDYRAYGGAASVQRWWRQKGRAGGGRVGSKSAGVVGMGSQGARSEATVTQDRHWCWPWHARLGPAATRRHWPAVRAAERSTTLPGQSRARAPGTARQPAAAPAAVGVGVACACRCGRREIWNTGGRLRSQPAMQIQPSLCLAAPPGLPCPALDRPVLS